MLLGHSSFCLQPYTESESEVAQSCPTLCDPVDCSSPGSSVHGILQARMLEWVAISFSRGSSQPRDRTQVSRIAGRHFNFWATRDFIIMCKFLYVSAHVYISLKKYAPFIWLLMGSISRKGKNHWIRPGLVSISFDLLLSQTLFTHMDSLQCCVSRATLKNHSLARKWRNA